jgi:hypothetical protein
MAPSGYFISVIAMTYLELNNDDKWILATAVSSQIGAYSQLLKSRNLSKKEKEGISRLKYTLSTILIALQTLE